MLLCLPLKTGDRGSNPLSFTKFYIMREYNREIEVDYDYGTVFTIKQWSDFKDKCYMDYDGYGYWVKNGYESKDEVFSTEPEDATHVVWYNK